MAGRLLWSEVAPTGSSSCSVAASPWLPAPQASGARRRWPALTAWLPPTARSFAFVFVSIAYDVAAVVIFVVGSQKQPTVQT
jgi:hypothetical protein